MFEVVKDVLLAKSWLWEFREKYLKWIRYPWAYLWKKHWGVGVLVVDKKDRIALIKIFRIPLMKQLREMVRGSGEPNLTYQQVAQKEVEEELGVKPQQIQKLWYLTPDSGILATQPPLFLAIVDDFEKYDVWWKDDGSYEFIFERNYFSFEQVQKMIKNGEITDAFLINAICLRKLKFKK